MKHLRTIIFLYIYISLLDAALGKIGCGKRHIYPYTIDIKNTKKLNYKSKHKRT